MNLDFRWTLSSNHLSLIMDKTTGSIRYLYLKSDSKPADYLRK